MKNWQKFLIPTMISLAIAGIYLFTVWRHRQDPGVASHTNAEQILSKDDLVVMRAFFPQHLRTQSGWKEQPSG